MKISIDNFSISILPSSLTFHHSPFLISHSPFAISHSSISYFIAFSLSFYHFPFLIPYSLFDISHCPLLIRFLLVHFSFPISGSPLLNSLFLVFCSLSRPCSLPCSFFADCDFSWKLADNLLDDEYDDAELTNTTTLFPGYHLHFLQNGHLL